MSNTQSERATSHVKFPTPKAIKALVLFLVYVGCLALAGALINQVWPSQSPEPVGGFVQTTGVVEATYPSQHNEVRYRYSVAGRTYEGAWYADGPEGNASDLRIGQTITVWYEVAVPSHSCSCVDPQEMLATNNDTTPQTLAAFILVTVTFLGLAGRLLFGRWSSIFESARTLMSRQSGTGDASPTPPEPPEGREWG